VLRPVRTTQVFASGSGRSRTFSGTARAGLESRLSFKVSGTVETVPVKVGDRVRSGQRIATLDDTDYQLQVEDAQASLARARAEARNAEANLARIRGLYENNNASQNDLDAARTAFESASANVNSIDKRLELAQNQVNYTRLTAPVAGAIAEVNVERNENVRAGQTIVVLSSGSRPEVSITVPEALISSIRTGQSVSVEVAALDNGTFAATVSEVGVASAGLGTTYPVVVRLDEDTDAVRPGMAAEVQFQFTSDDGEDRMLVPAYAVGEDGDGRFVWILQAADDGTGVVHRRGVEIGDITGDGIEILDGLEDGEFIVTAGVSRITAGQRVRLNAAGDAAS
jgi:RND family efflux transporter MFP subunit